MLVGSRGISSERANTKARVSVAHIRGRIYNRVMAHKKIPTHYRLTLLTLELINATAARMHFDKTSVVEIAVRRYAEEVLGVKRCKEIAKGCDDFYWELLIEHAKEREARMGGK